MEENTTVDISAVNEKIAQESAFIDLLILEMNKAIVGQKHMVERLLIGLWVRVIFYWKVCRVWLKHWLSIHSPVL